MLGHVRYGVVVTGVEVPEQQSWMLRSILVGELMAFEVEHVLRQSI